MIKFTDASITLNILEERLEKIGMEYICLTMFILCSMTLVFLTPPMQVPDEPNHFVRAYQISEGIFSSPSQEDTEGNKYFYGKVPASFEVLLPKVVSIFDSAHSASFPLILRTLDTPLEPSNVGLIYITNTGQYTPVAYIPQSVGAWIGRSLDLSVGSTFYLMRSLAVLFVAVSIFVSIKILKKMRLLIFILAMMPMFLYESASISADAVTFALAILITSYLLSLCQSSAPLSRKDYILLISASIILGLIKQVYGVLLFLYFLIPYRSVGSKGKFYLTGLVLIMIFTFTSMWWVSFMYSGSSPQVAVGPGADPVAQLNLLKENPLHYFKVYSFTLQSYFSLYLHQFIGVLGWLTLSLPKWFYNLYCIILVASSIFSSLKLSLKQRVLIFFGVSASVSVIFLNQYITWTPLNMPTIEGVQGRYFIPLALMLLSALSCPKRLKYENVIGCTAGLLSAIVTIPSIVDYFY